jgi:lipoyl(octanoyl) transferase
MTEVNYRDLGLIDYKEAWDLQEELLQENAQVKIAARLQGESSALAKTKNTLIFCEHPHVYTLGKSGLESHLLVDEEGLKKINAVFYKNNRGGDITYHGPGQIVGYPIFDLEYFFTDLHKYLRYLEAAIINMLKHYDIKSGRIEGLTGVWIDGDKPGRERKICAMGVRCSRWITMHGFAMNVNTDLSYFDHIIPCGIDDKAVTSMEKELGYKPSFDEVKQVLKSAMADQFGYQYV